MGPESSRKPGELSAKAEALFEQGRALFESGCHERAIHVWTRILFLERGNPRVRRAIEEAKRELAERQRKLDVEIALARRHLEEGDVESAARRIRSVLEVDPGHGEARSLEESLAASERRAVVTREVEEGFEIGSGSPTGASTPPSKRGLLLKVPRKAPSHRRAASPMKMGLFLLAAVAVFATGALYLHFNWESLVSDGAFGQGGPLDAAASVEQEALAVPDPSELRYYNAERLVEKGRYREALRELAAVDRGSAVAASARSLILRIEERLLRSTSDRETQGKGEGSR